MKLSDMKHVLSAGNIRLTKSLGQNFLHDANQLQKIIDRAELAPTDKVLEIGPGLGPLTQLLLERAGQVLAIEKDARLITVLHKRFSESLSNAKLTLLHDDALKFLKHDPRDWHDWKLVANLPYSVASPILVELAKGTSSPERIVVTLQMEVARRLAATPGQADYGVLTLLIQRDFDPLDWFKIPPGSFFPEPDVDSACVTLRRRSTQILRTDCRDLFTKIVKRSFSQRRKMMLKLLKQDWPPDALAAAFHAAMIKTDTRAEHVSLDAFAHLAEALQDHKHGI